MSRDRAETAAHLKQLQALMRSRGIRDERVLNAIRRVPREYFVPREYREEAYADRSLPLSRGQTISQPYIVARMTELLRLKGPENVLEVGTGSGYQTAILALLAARVVTIERIPELQESARSILRHLRNVQIEFHTGDGTLGWPEGAPYDAIIVTAAAPKVPEPLYAQLAPGGRLVLPVGSEADQVLQLVEKGLDGPIVTTDCYCRFVPLIGAAAWPEQPSPDTP